MNYFQYLSEHVQGGNVRRQMERRIYNVRTLFQDHIMLRGGILTMLFVYRVVAICITRIIRLSGVSLLTRGFPDDMLCLVREPCSIAIGAYWS